MSAIIGDMYAADLQAGFLETLGSLGEIGLTPQAALLVFQSRLRAGHRTYVARGAERIVGTATLLVERKFLRGGAPVGHLEDLAVHPDHRRQGIGSALVRHVADEAKKLGCGRLLLRCGPEFAPFFTRLGCVQHEAGLRWDL
ncbi:MAG: GNAT family N-acetyltransferase [Planctomycetia bacterium]|nr:GNAT family N-acetyltransferase [Planctomycetia bacterium]